MSWISTEDVFTEWQSFVGHVDPLFRFLAATWTIVDAVG